MSKIVKLIFRTFVAIAIIIYGVFIGFAIKRIMLRNKKIETQGSRQNADGAWQSEVPLPIAMPEPDHIWTSEYRSYVQRFYLYKMKDGGKVYSPKFYDTQRNEWFTCHHGCDCGEDENIICGGEHYIYYDRKENSVWTSTAIVPRKP